MHAHRHLCEDITLIQSFEVKRTNQNVDSQKLEPNRKKKMKALKIKNLFYKSDKMQQRKQQKT